MTNTKTPSLERLAQVAINSALKDVHTALPGIIEAFDSDTQLAEIQIAVSRIYVNDRVIPIPKLIKVPVWFPRGGGFTITLPVKKGDECLVVFNERSIDNWNKFGDVRKPNDKRKHDISDGIAFVGFSSQPNKIDSFATDDLEVRNDAANQRITLKANGDIIIDTPASDVTVNCAKAEVNATTQMDITTPLFTVDAVQSVFTGKVDIMGLLTWVAGMAGSGGSGAAVTGNMAITSGDVKADGVGLKTHKHTQGGDSGGDTQVTTNVGAG